MLSRFPATPADYSAPARPPVSSPAHRRCAWLRRGEAAAHPVAPPRTAASAPARPPVSPPVSPPARCSPRAASWPPWHQNTAARPLAPPLELTCFSRHPRKRLLAHCRRPPPGYNLPPCWDQVTVTPSSVTPPAPPPPIHAAVTGLVRAVPAKTKTLSPGQLPENGVLSLLISVPLCPLPSSLPYEPLSVSGLTMS